MQVAGFIASLNVKAVITGSIGPKAFATLQASNIKAYLVTNGTAESALEKFKVGQLQPALSANAKSHNSQGSP